MNTPNILWIQTDEQRPDSLACYGSAWAKTPNVDRIASRGTVFRNAVCPTPMCLPSRSGQLSARHPHEFSCLNNMLLKHIEDYPEGYITFPEVLQQAGYETINFGRYHCVRKQVFGRMERTGDFLPEVTNHYGLNETYDESEYHVIKRPGPDRRPLIIAGTYPGETGPNRMSADRAIEFLGSRSGNETPFMLRVSFNQPHTPTLAPPPFDSLYDPDDLPIRRYDRSAYETRSEFDRRIADLHRMDLLNEGQIRQVWKDYMGLCAYIDMEIGRVLDALEDSGLSENTLIMYSTDHGKSLGEWGSGEKGTFDREVWRVPFIWSFPGTIPVGIDEAPCGTIDTGRTLLNAIGLGEAIPDSWRGRDLFAPTIDSAPAATSNATMNPRLGRLAFGTIRHDTSDWPGFDPDLFRVAVRSRRYRLDVNWCTDGSRPDTGRFDGTLFDLDSDPFETRNVFDDLAGDPDREALLTAIERWFTECPTGEIMSDPANAGTCF